MLLRGQDIHYYIMTELSKFFFATNWHQTTDADQDLRSTEIQAYK